MRKNNNFNIMDRINVEYSGDDLVKEAISKYTLEIQKEILADNIDVNEGKEEVDLNGHEASISINRI